MSKNRNSLIIIPWIVSASLFLCACSGRTEKNPTQSEEILLINEAGVEDEADSPKVELSETEPEEISDGMDADDSSDSEQMETERSDESQLEQYDEGWSEEKILGEIRKRKPYLENCSFYGDVNQYMENVRGVTDISIYTEYLFATDKQLYSESDFEDVPPLIIHLAKNEIYARYGYIFKNEDLNNYFCGQLWYLPQKSAEEFDDSVFNEYERKDLKLLSDLDNESVSVNLK